MTNKEAAQSIRDWVASYKKGRKGIFSWPTDTCSEEQRIKFLSYKSMKWPNYQGTYVDFVLEYIELLELESSE